MERIMENFLKVQGEMGKMFPFPPFSAFDLMP